MKKFECIALFSIILLLAIRTQAQTLIAVQNGGIPKFYSILQDAITSAQNKDTIYIPGGAYSFTDNITINKELHLIGTGHNPDSTATTGITQLNATIYLVAGANNSTFEGLSNFGFISGKSTSDEDVDNITISRCNCNGPIALSGLSTNWLIYESIVASSIIGLSVSSSSYAQNNLFSNNLIQGTINYFGPNNIFKNNYFLGPSIILNNNDGCLFQNNIFAYSSQYGNITSCIFNNNLFIDDASIPGGSLGSNNIFSQSLTSTFVNQSGNTFNYAHDYHLKTDSPGKGAGKDGTDIGIYGGAYPWKAGSIPTNPHFQRINISPKTDNSGNLNVKIKVAAQDY